ncbi:MAG: tetratricopeptide repeat protein [Burkholderiales bacterium]|nr:tetratricopeptide repeat protein [Burkholderiales bacterium]
MEQAGDRTAPERKLAAIMLADIAGFSSLMEKDEAGTFERIRNLRAQLIAPRVAEHGGRIIKTTGDGFLAEFPSATSALQCAIAIQRQNHSQQLALPADQRIHIRIGINVGDIIIDGEDVAGDGVVIAARLEPLAPLDGICVSATVREHIRQELGIEYQDLGDQRVKNISRPIRAYKIDLAGKAGVQAKPGTRKGKRGTRAAIAAVATLAVVAIAIFATPRHLLPWQLAETRTSPSADTRMTFAVIPLAGPANDAPAAQFASSVTEALIARQTNSPWSRVVSRESVEAAMKKNPSSMELGRALNVRYLVRGHVARNADSFATGLSIVNAESGQVLGTREFSWPAGKPINVYRQEFDNAIGYLAGRGYRLEVAQAKQKRSEDLDARDLAYLANDAWNNDQASYEKAMPLLRRALAQSPGDRLALMLVARINLCECRKHWSNAPGEQEKIGADALDTYLSRYGEDRNMLMQKIGLYQLHGRFEDALVIFERLLEKSPEDPELLSGMAYDYLKLGKAKEGLALLERAKREDRSFEERGLAAALHFKLGHYGEAAELARKAGAELNKQERADPWAGSILLVRAAAEAHAGRTLQAKSALEDYYSAAPDAKTISAVRKRQDPRADLADHEPLYEGLRKAGMPE